MRERLLAVLCVLTLIGASGALAAPAKDLYGGRNAGNTGFANIVSDDITGDVHGWVRYSKEGACLRATWDLWDLEQGEEYQLKIHSIEGDTRILACDPAHNPGKCGTVPGGTYLVMDVVGSNPGGHLGRATHECRLPAGDYGKMMFLVTREQGPHTTGHTWQHSPGDGVSTFTIR